MSYSDVLLHINGTWRKSHSGQTIPVLNPATEEEIGTVAHADKADLDQERAVALMAANPSCIKRPIVEHPGGLLIGFREAEWAAALG